MDTKFNFKKLSKVNTKLTGFYIGGVFGREGPGLYFTLSLTPYCYRSLSTTKLRLTLGDMTLKGRVFILPLHYLLFLFLLVFIIIDKYEVRNSL